MSKRQEGPWPTIHRLVGFARGTEGDRRVQDQRTAAFLPERERSERLMVAVPRFVPQTPSFVLFMIQYIDVGPIMLDRREMLMRHSLGLAFALTIVTSLPAATQNAPIHRNTPVRGHHAAQPVKRTPVPAVENSSHDTVHRPFAPYPHTGDSDHDGLRRDPDDCNKGCIDGNPG